MDLIFSFKNHCRGMADSPRVGLVLSGKSNLATQTEEDPSKSPNHY